MVLQSTLDDFGAFSRMQLDWLVVGFHRWTPSDPS